MINITGGTVNAVTRRDSKPAIGTVNGNLDLTINSSTGKTTVNAYTTGSDSLPLIGTGHYDSSWKSSISPSEGAEYNEDGSSHLGEDNAAIINSYCNTPLGTDKYKAPKTLDDGAFHSTSEFQGTIYNAKYTLSDKDKDKGDLYKVVHNRKYMEEHPDIVDTSKLENSDLHDWQLVDKVAQIDQNDDLYVSMLCESRYNAVDYEEKKFKGLEEFLFHIFDQEKEQAYRRPRYYRSYWHEVYLEE